MHVLSQDVAGDTSWDNYLLQLHTVPGFLPGPQWTEFNMYWLFANATGNLCTVNPEI